MNTTNNDKNKNTNSLTQLLFERNSQQFKVNYNLILQSIRQSVTIPSAHYINIFGISNTFNTSLIAFHCQVIDITIKNDQLSLTIP